MTSALEKAFNKASHLPAAAQDQLAEQMLEDLEGEAKWDQIFAKSQDLLEKMANKALQELEEGKTVEKGWDEL